LSAVYREGDNCVFQLEPLGITLAKYLVSDHKAVVPILVRLVEIISYFKTKYGFSHNDLKLNNVMTGEGNAIGNLKLIDFGLSSIKIGTNEIGKPSLSKADMPYLFHNLKMELEGKAYASNNVDEELLASDLFKLAESLSELPAETPIKTYIDRLQGLKGGFRNTRRLRRLRLATRTRKNMY
jgi:serine/threonine protein kinase